MRFGVLTLVLLALAAPAVAQTPPPESAPSTPAPVAAAPAPAPAAAAPASAPAPVATTAAPVPAAGAAAAAPPGAPVPPGTATASGAPVPPGTTVPGAPGAQGTQAQPQEEQPKGSFWTSCGPQILMLVVMFGIFYFLLIRPQQKRAREHQDLLKALKKGDRVVTNGGIFGTVTGIDDKIAVIEISEKVRIKVLRSQVAGKADSNLESLSNNR
jgi:preprotein translocase subunit YajC